MAGVLESYTARCEGTPQALALEDGTILPPVPLLKFPTVKSALYALPTLVMYKNFFHKKNGFANGKSLCYDAVVKVIIKY